MKNESSILPSGPNQKNQIACIYEVDISRISINPHQPRKYFKEHDLDELAASIKEVGIIHPPFVRPLPNSENFELIAGERRLRAAKIAGLSKIPVLVKDTDDMYSAQAALIENVQRQDLNPLEIAKALQELTKQYGFNQQELASKIGKQRSTVANYLRLLSLPESIQINLRQGLITMGHAKAILSLPSAEKQQLLHEIIQRDDLTVRQTEQLATKLTKKAKSGKLIYRTRDFYLEDLAEQIQRKLGSKVNIQSLGKKRGRISIEYYDWDDLSRLLTLMNCEEDQKSL
ncbi:MAG: ParB family chromosome partitioning protein [Chlamydiales bacterium]|jgi:ParB family chromosome partitioning protein